MIPFLVLGIVIVLFSPVVIFYRSIMVDIIGQLVQSRPDDYSGWCYYGTLLERQGNYIEAYDAFKKAVALSPNYSEAWEKMGDVLTKLGDSAGAADAYQNSYS